MSNRDTKQNNSSKKNAPQASHSKKQNDRQNSDKMMSVDSQSEFAVADKLRDKADAINKKS
ncbi:MAG: hypothetical protein REI95_14685 [Oxalicibacterium faecigallinarum]|uniref:YfhD family protein n=1 Tax=Oxalicibacterium faecigallinarum TaxID=573741 RepID=A0A8J3ARD2_9BURK|nr:hypothetical protein [Oxalicibacterium faecigallinarum]MDQ7970877.1 hypothetical protein [Oxalicibacterium faecigallinarum]GGI17400.1 hypothetical protein GCM10008066_08790 [Oxalicibacterium faecigallinarum]